MVNAVVSVQKRSVRFDGDSAGDGGAGCGALGPPPAVPSSPVSHPDYDKHGVYVIPRKWKGENRSISLLRSSVDTIRMGQKCTWNPASWELLIVLLSECKSAASLTGSATLNLGDFGEVEFYSSCANMPNFQWHFSQDNVNVYIANSQGPCDTGNVFFQFGSDWCQRGGDLSARVDRFVERVLFLGVAEIGQQLINQVDLASDYLAPKGWRMPYSKMMDDGRHWPSKTKPALLGNERYGRTLYYGKPSKNTHSVKVYDKGLEIYHMNRAAHMLDLWGLDMVSATSVFRVEVSIGKPYWRGRRSETLAHALQRQRWMWRDALHRQQFVTARGRATRIWEFLESSGFLQFPHGESYPLDARPDSTELSSAAYVYRRGVPFLLGYARKEGLIGQPGHVVAQHLLRSMHAPGVIEALQDGGLDMSAPF